MKRHPVKEASQGLALLSQGLTWKLPPRAWPKNPQPVLPRKEATCPSAPCLKSSWSYNTVSQHCQITVNQYTQCQRVPPFKMGDFVTCKFHQPKTKRKRRRSRSSSSSAAAQAVSHAATPPRKRDSTHRTGSS